MIATKETVQNKKETHLFHAQLVPNE